MWNLDRVGVAHHVVGEYDVSLARQANSERRPRIDGVVLKTPVRPMTLRIENAGMLRLFVARAVKVPAEPESGQGFDQNLFDGVIFRHNLAEDLRMKRSFFRHRRQSRSYQNLITEKCLAFFPFFETREAG